MMIKWKTIEKLFKRKTTLDKINNYNMCILTKPL